MQPNWINFVSELTWTNAEQLAYPGQIKMYYHFFLLSILLNLLIGCGTSPLIVEDVTKLIHDHENLDSKIVNLAGYARDNVLKGYLFVKWRFTLTDGQTSVTCYEKGYNYSVLKRAFRLVSKAIQAEEIIRVTGRFHDIRRPDQRLNNAPEIELISIEYKGRRIYTDLNDYDPFMLRYQHRSHYPHWIPHDKPHL